MCLAVEGDWLAGMMTTEDPAVGTTMVGLEVGDDPAEGIMSTEGPTVADGTVVPAGDKPGGGPGGPNEEEPAEGTTCRSGLDFLVGPCGGEGGGLWFSDWGIMTSSGWPNCRGTTGGAGDTGGAGGMY